MKYYLAVDIGASSGRHILAHLEDEKIVLEEMYRFTNGNVTTLYAHCKSLYINQGDKISKGMEIAEVGSTGRATGPHLHFEIRAYDRLVNPEYVLKF